MKPTYNLLIALDSSADHVTLKSIAIASVPLKIITTVKEYVDDASLDVDQMVDELEAYSGKSGSACPSPADWLNAFGDCERIFCITITSGLSGSYNSACVAKAEYEQAHPERKVCVIDSLSAGPELKLIAEKIDEMLGGGMDYDTVCKEIAEYQKHTGLLFMLRCVKNLANNGRINPLVAKIVGLLGIRIVGKASEKGILAPLEKPRGDKKALISLYAQMKKQGYSGGKVRIGHCRNEAAVKELCGYIKAEFPMADIEHYRLRALCSFYAEDGGLLIGYEH